MQTHLPAERIKDVLERVSLYRRTSATQITVLVAAPGSTDVAEIHSNLMLLCTPRSCI